MIVNNALWRRTRFSTSPRRAPAPCECRFARPLRHGVRHDAVETDRGQCDATPDRMATSTAYILGRVIELDTICSIVATLSTVACAST